MADDSVDSLPSKPANTQADSFFYGRSMPKPKQAPQAAPQAEMQGGSDAPTEVVEAPKTIEAPTPTAQVKAPEATPAVETSAESAEPEEKDPYADRFEQLVKMSKELRQQKQSVEQQSESVKKAEELLAKLDRDPIAFIEERYGPKAYQDYTDRVLGKKKDNTQDVLLKQLEAMSAKMEAMQQELAAVRTAPETQREQGQWQNLASTYYGMIDKEIEKTEHAVVGRFYSAEEARDRVHKEVQRVTEQHAELLGRDLTIEEARHLLATELTPSKLVGKMAKDLKSRLQKANQEPNPGNAPAGEPKKTVPQRPQASQSGPDTLTGDLGKDVSHQTSEDFDMLPPRERMRRIAARYR